MKGKLLFMTLALLASLWGMAFAVTTANISTSAQVPNNPPDMSIQVFELTNPGQDPFTGTNVTGLGMQFGPLSHNLADGSEAGIWFSPKFYAVMIFTNSFGKRYQVTSTSAGLVSGAVSLPGGSFGLTPGYSEFDQFSAGVSQGAQPVGSVLGAAGPAVATDKIIYQSEVAASNRIIRAFYSIPPFAAGGAAPFPGFQPIPLSQAPGVYSGQVVLTISAF